MRPTLEDYQWYRRQRRLTVRRIVQSISSQTIPRTDWGLTTIKLARQEHTASIKRQNKFGTEELPKQEMS